METKRYTNYVAQERDVERRVKIAGWAPPPLILNRCPIYADLLAWAEGGPLPKGRRMKGVLMEAIVVAVAIAALWGIWLLLERVFNFIEGKDQWKRILLAALALAGCHQVESTERGVRSTYGKIDPDGRRAGGW